VAINVIDSCWGSFQHISNRYVSRGRYEIIGRFMQTPAHHRIHHAKNPRYMDRNYNSITLFLDAVFGTLEPLRADEPVEFGITRPVDDGSFCDVHFGEFVELLHDMRNASSLHESIAYALRAPGW
jgi:sterol desaturase/sphingolipid hydroxylase (fatty acid hydroxylase superfamily)